MILKYVMLAISALSLQKGSADTSQNTIELAKKAIRAEVLGMAFKILFGVVLVAAIIFSLFQLGDAANAFIAQMENGDTIRLVVFGSVAFIGSILLFFLFNGSGRPSFLKSPPPPAKVNAIDFQAIALQFIEGFMNGLEAEKRKEKSETSDLKADF